MFNIIVLPKMVKLKTESAKFSPNFLRFAISQITSLNHVNQQ